MYIIGITGTLGAGKSTVGGFLAALGAEVIDADAVVHRLYAPGGKLVPQVIARFGVDVRAADGGVDRSALARRVFANAADLEWLEGLVHPEVDGEIRHEVRAAQRRGTDLLVVDAVKLVESGLRGLADELWIVMSGEAQQLQRLRTCRGMSEKEARRRLANQSTLAQTVERFREGSARPRPVVVIDNSGSREDTRRQVQRVWWGLAARRGPARAHRHGG